MKQVLDIDRLLEHHLLMCRVRAFEEAALQANTENLVLGAIHPSIGQEAVASGICFNLQKEDLLTSTHRGHGHTLAKGADPRVMMRELLGREGGSSHGKGGSMHIADFSVGMLGANGVVGANIHISAGAAHAIKLLKEQRIVCSIFGDGAINRGPFLEGLNWAVVFHLPVLFVCEDNGFASTTRTSAVTGGDGPAARAEALGVPSTTVDGNDLIEVDEAARSVMPSIRQGKGPHMIVARTYRLVGHTASDPDLYRPREEVEKAWKKDPIMRLRKVLQQTDIDLAILEQHELSAIKEMDGVFAEAKAAPWPPLTRAFEDVQDIGDPRQEAF
ncbi:MAG TPA: thiamine pyrophosphate-dependent dehydrogenase E1 component subunit alpha [SAR324 cluster bacterium]|jgi:pyruvate dehydrogenase E1 component alpha subunit|nr:thiamine pyrophosphate-dependent dehydrogenase E1 component subunit alpha [SAR324 cluster bacterium]|tara:strand:+ start:1225 stop:2214 length:990 start_codon:yes stop_codon:yes gene_type:complete